jgi:RNA polymerase sigma-70 factor (ECF subfamily)
LIEKEQEFLTRIEKHKGILYKVSKMYMDNHDDQQDLFQEIVCQLWNGGYIISTENTPTKSGK